jgi:hypothetical protein
MLRKDDSLTSCQNVFFARASHTPLVVVFWQTFINWAYSQLGCPKGWSNRKMTTKDYFQFLLHLLFHDYRGLIYDYNYNDVMLIY